MHARLRGTVMAGNTRARHLIKNMSRGGHGRTKPDSHHSVDTDKKERAVIASNRDHDSRAKMVPDT